MKALMEKHPHLFTIDEANALIPQIENILTRFDRKKQVSEKLHDELLMEELLRERGSLGAQASDLERLESFLAEEIVKLDNTIQEIESEIQAIRSMGCKVRNLSKGLIDFPAEQNGSAIFYVWKRGESAVHYYRKIEDRASLFPLEA